MHLTRLLFTILLAMIVNATGPLYAGLREIIPRPQQMGILSEDPLIVNGTFYLIIPADVSADEQVAITEIMRLYGEKTSRILVPIEWPDYDGEFPSIWLGTENRFPELAAMLDSSGISGLGHCSHSEEYQLLVEEDRILMLCEDLRAMRWSMMSLLQLAGDLNGSLAVERAYIRDWPDFEERVASMNSPLRVDYQLDFCNAVLDSSYPYRMNEIEWNNSDTGKHPSTFTNSGREFYYSNASEFSERMKRRGQFLTVSADNTAIKVDARSWQEAIPIENTPMSVGSSSFAVIPDGYNIEIQNPSFDSWSGGEAVGWEPWRDSLWYHFTRDFVVRHHGSSSLKISTPGTGMALRQYVDLQPYGYYNLRFWIKTSNFSGSFQFDGQGPPPVSNSVIKWTVHAQIGANQDWTEIVIPFSSYHLDNILLLLGVTSLNSGSVWLDDVRIEAAEPTRMVRRTDTPLRVYEEPGHILRTEGIDYRVVESPADTFVNYLEYPRFERISGGALNFNDRVSVDWGCGHLFQAGRETVCFSLLDPLQAYQDRIRIADSTTNPGGYKIHINEISYAGHDQLCQARNLTPAQLVGQYCQQMFEIVRAYDPAAPVRIYGDGFDYHVYDNRAMPTSTSPWTRGENGQGTLHQLSTDVEIMAMALYTSNLDSTFITYEQMGFNSVVSLYADWRLDVNIGHALTARNYDHCRGLLVYAWDADWTSKMWLFASLAWNTGPYIVHKPTHSVIEGDSVSIKAEIWTDRLEGPVEPTIVSAVVRYRWVPGGNWTEATMQQTGDDTYELMIPPAQQIADYLEYRIQTTDSRQQTRSAPAQAGEVFSAIFGSASSERLDRKLIDIDPTVSSLGDFTLIEWEPIPGAECYELYRGGEGITPNALIARQAADTPRFLIGGKLSSQIEVKDVKVYARIPDIAKEKKQTAARK